MDALNRIVVSLGNPAEIFRGQYYDFLKYFRRKKMMTNLSIATQLTAVKAEKMLGHILKDEENNRFGSVGKLGKFKIVYIVPSARHLLLHIKLGCSEKHEL
jgi:hypothetical protein